MVGFLQARAEKFRKGILLAPCLVYFGCRDSTEVRQEAECFQQCFCLYTLLLLELWWTKHLIAFGCCMYAQQIKQKIEKKEKNIYRNKKTEKTSKFFFPRCFCVHKGSIWPPRTRSFRNSSNFLRTEPSIHCFFYVWTNWPRKFSVRAGSKLAV